MRLGVEWLIHLSEFSAFGRSKPYRALVLGISQIGTYGSGKDNILSIRAPYWIALYKFRIICTGQLTKRACFSIEHAQNTLDGEE